MKCFILQRHQDKSGVSGTGTVAEGVMFENGKVALAWLSDYATVTLFENVKDVVTLHGHNGETELIWQEGGKNANPRLSLQSLFGRDGANTVHNRSRQAVC